MIKIIGNDLWRGGSKIGWLEDNDVFGDDGRKAGYYLGNDIYGADGRKLAYLQGNRLYVLDGQELQMDDVRRKIGGGSLGDLGRAAIRVLLGE